MLDNPFSIIFYVTDVEQSCGLYTRLLGREPTEASPNFAMYPLSGARGAHLALWKRTDVTPAVDSTGIEGELAFVAFGRAAVDALHAGWVELGVRIVQAPATMDFGYTFTGVDRDGHRLRVFAPAGGEPSA